jgi:hypothetical protein
MKWCYKIQKLSQPVLEDKIHFAPKKLFIWLLYMKTIDVNSLPFIHQIQLKALNLIKFNYNQNHIISTFHHPLDQDDTKALDPPKNKK